MVNRHSLASGIIIFLLLVAFLFFIDYTLKERAHNQHQIEKLNAQIDYLREKSIPDSEKHIRDIVAFIQHKYRRIPVEMAYLIATHINRWSIENNLNPAVVVGIIDVESDFNPLAVSSKGARGLMQIIPSFWREELAVSSDFDFHGIETNVRAGIYIYLKYLEMENYNIRRALNRYNGSDRDKGEYASKVYQSIGEFTAFRYLMAKADEAPSDSPEPDKSLTEVTKNKSDSDQAASPEQDSPNPDEQAIVESDITEGKP